MKNIIFFLQENFEDYLQTGAFFASILSSTSLNDLYVVFKIWRLNVPKMWMQSLLWRCLLGETRQKGLLHEQSESGQQLANYLLLQVVHLSMALVSVGMGFFFSTFLCCVEPAAEVLLVLIQSAVIKRSLLISLEHPGQPSCLSGWKSGGWSLVSKDQYVRRKLAALEGSNWARWVGLAKVCSQYGSAISEQPEFKSAVCVFYSSVMSRLLFWGSCCPCSWEVWWQSEQGVVTVWASMFISPNTG